MKVGVAALSGSLLPWPRTAARQAQRGSRSAAQSAAAGSNPAEVGEWSAPIPGPRPVIGVHAVLVHTGKVFLLESRKAYLWDPAKGSGQPFEAPADLFCAGHVVLGNGDVLLAGGRNGRYGRGLNVVYTFEPSTATWTRHPDMREGRWYPTLTVLSDGRVVITAGNNSDGSAINRDVELYAGGALSLVGSRLFYHYPNQFLLPDGNVLVADARRRAALLDPETWSFTNLATMSEERADAGGVLLPGGTHGSSTVMVAGGGPKHSTLVSNTVEAFDASNPGAGWNYRAPLPEPRAHMNLVILPDGTLLGVGGTNDTGGQFHSLLYDPAADTWTRMASQAEERGYHSTALLLPDGRVLSAGDNFPPGGRTTLEVYSPPYLFRGARPVITAAPRRIRWGRTFVITVTGEVARAVLLRPGAVTHSLNMDQRHVELAFDRRGNRISVSAPPSPHVAPEGYYLLFVLDGQGVPSVARWVRL